MPVNLSTLNRQFFTTAYESPALMSEIVAFSRNACLTREFMNTVHRVPRSQGDAASMASSAKRLTR